MTAVFKNLECDQGATFKLALRLLQPGTRLPRDLTGYQARMQVRQSASSPAVIADLSTDNGSIIIEAADGKIFIALSKEETAALKVPHDKSGFPLVTKAVFDLMLTLPNTETICLLRGNFTITAGVTR